MERQAVSTAELLRERLEAHWSTLAPRDRRAVQIGGIALAVILPALVAWSLHESLTARRASLAESRLLVSSAGQRVAARLAAGADITAAASDATALQSRVMRAAARVGIDSASMTLESQGGGQLRIGLRDTPFASVTTLLGALARWEGITIVSADIARTAPGRVEASLVLRAP